MPKQREKPWPTPVSAEDRSCVGGEPTAELEDEVVGKMMVPPARLGHEVERAVTDLELCKTPLQVAA